MDESVENGRPVLGPSGGHASAGGPADSQMTNYTIPGILHFIKHEWSRFEKEKAAWEVEKTELQAKIAFLQGERRGHENLMRDLVRRIKMLEFALKQERAKLYKAQNKELKFSDVAPPAKETANNSPVMDLAAIVNQKEESRRVLREYLREVGFSDTVLEARVARINAYRNLYTQNQTEPNTTPPSNSIWVATHPPNPLPSLQALPQSLSNGPIIANGTDTQAQQGSSSPTHSPTSQFPLEPNRPPIEEGERNQEPPAGGELISEDGALASFDFLASTGDSDSEEEDEEEEEEEEDEEEEGEEGGDPTVSADDDFTSGFNEEGTMQETAPERETSKSWEISSELSKYRESRARRGRSAQPFQRPSRKVMDQLRNLSDTNPPPSSSSSSSSTGQVEGKAAAAARVTHPESIFSLPTHSEEKIGVEVLGPLANLVKFNPESTEMGPPSQSSKRWDIKYSMRSHFDVVTSVSFHPTDAMVLTGSHDRTLKLWSLQSRKPGQHWVDLEPVHTFRGHRGSVLSVAVGQLGDVCFSGSSDTTIRVWKVPPSDSDPFDTYDAEVHRGVLQGHTDAIWDLDVHPKTGLLLSCAADGSCRLWNHTLTSPQVKLFQAEPGYGNPTSVAFLSNDPHHLVASYSAAKAVIFDIETAQPIVDLDSGTTYDGTLNTQINKVTAHPTLPVIVTAHEDKYIRFYDAVSGKVVHSMTGHTDSVTGLAMDPHGLYLLSGGHDGSLRFWNMDSKVCIQEVPAHRKHYDEAICNVACHLSKPFFASAGADGIAKVLE